MKKLAIAVAVAATTVSLSAAELSTGISYQSPKDGSSTYAHTLSVGTKMSDFEVGVDSRITRVDSETYDIAVEASIGKQFGNFTPFVAIVTDHGLKGLSRESYQYGVVGVDAAWPVVGKWNVLAHARTTVNWDDIAPRQTIATIGTSYALTKTLSVVGTVGRSYHDVQDDRVSLGIRTTF